MKSKGQVSLDFIFALILFTIIVGALQTLVTKSYEDQNNIGVRGQAKFISLGISNAAAAKQVLLTSNATSQVEFLIPQVEEARLFIVTCKGKIENNKAQLNVKLSPGFEILSINAETDILFGNLNAEIVNCRESLEVNAS